MATTLLVSGARARVKKGRGVGSGMASTIKKKADTLCAGFLKNYRLRISLQAQSMPPG
jgi:hypothetical protein